MLEVVLSNQFKRDLKRAVWRVTSDMAVLYRRSVPRVNAGKNGPFYFRRVLMENFGVLMKNKGEIS